MKKDIMKRFFAEEEGMEALQVVMIGACAAVVCTGGYLFAKNYVFPYFKAKQDGLEQTADPEALGKATKSDQG